MSNALTPSSTGAARRLAMVLAVAGTAVLGSVVTAPAASASPLAPVASVAPVVQDGPSTVIERHGKGGPDAFVVLEHGRQAIFFCDPAKPNKHHSKCLVEDGPRF
jgi:hypothetical protein